jgi:hypothetical protein
MNGTQQVPQGAPGGMPGGGFAGGPPGGMRGPGGFGMLPGGPMTSIVVLVLFAVTLIVLAIVFYKLFTKAGFNGALGLLMLVPVVNLGVALYLAFAEWPVLAELGRVKLEAASADLRSAVAAPEAAPGAPADPAIPAGA